VLETLHHLGREPSLPVVEARLPIFQAVVLAVDGVRRRTHVFACLLWYTVFPVPHRNARSILRVRCEFRVLDQIEVKGLASSAIIFLAGELDVATTVVSPAVTGGVVAVAAAVHQFGKAFGAPLQGLQTG